MISLSSSVHYYFILNGAIALGYMITRILLYFSKTRLSQLQRLKLARFTFIMIIMSFFIVPEIASWLPSTYSSNFQLGPMIKTVSGDFLQHQAASFSQFAETEAFRSISSLNDLLTFFLLTGIAIYFKKYFSSLTSLRHLRQKSACLHQIKDIHILFNDQQEIPFCWSGIKKHYVLIPSKLLENASDTKVAIRHELQHIRQGDTYWLHILQLNHVICFWNPFMKLWKSMLGELQEYACDESLVIKKKTSATLYATCLLNTASNALKTKLCPEGVIGMHHFAIQSTLYKRVNMLFNYRNYRSKSISLFLAYFVSFFTAVSTAYAFNASPNLAPLTEAQVETIIHQSHLDTNFQVTATKDVVDEINNIRGSSEARSYMLQSLQRMKQYQPAIQKQLAANNMPKELLVVPLVESGYQPLAADKNPVQAAGIWQIIPDTARRFGLTVSKQQDDRFDTQASSKAALTYLNKTHEQFHDWRLAMIAYEYGEQKTENLIQSTGSKDPWVIAKSSQAPANFAKFISQLDASLIIMQNPSLLS